MASDEPSVLSVATSKALETLRTLVAPPRGVWTTHRRFTAPKAKLLIECGEFLVKHGLDVKPTPGRGLCLLHSVSLCSTCIDQRFSSLKSATEEVMKFFAQANPFDRSVVLTSFLNLDLTRCWEPSRLDELRRGSDGKVDHLESFVCTQDGASKLRDAILGNWNTDVADIGAPIVGCIFAYNVKLFDFSSLTVHDFLTTGAKNTITVILNDNHFLCVWCCRF